MTHPDDEYGEIIRRALHAEADAVMPGGDGLDRIRTRITEREVRRYGALHGDLRAWFRSVLAQLADLRFAGWLTETWMRSAVTVGVALIAVGLAVSAPQTLDRITSTGNRDTAPGNDPGGSTSISEGSQAGSGAPAPRPSDDRPGAAPGASITPTSPLAAGSDDCPSSEPMPMTGTGTRPATTPSCPRSPTPTPPTSPSTPTEPAPSVEPSTTPQPAPAPETTSGVDGAQEEAG